MTKVPESEYPKGPDNLEQIRDIIFGAQKREYDHRFEEIVTELRRSQEEARQQNSDARTSLQKELEIGDKNIIAELETTSRTLAEMIVSLRQELTDTRSKLESELLAQKQEIAAEIDCHVTALRADKLSREALAQMLQEMASKLKDGTAAGELKKAARKSPAE